MRIARVDVEGTARFGVVVGDAVRLLDPALTPEILFTLGADQLLEQNNRSTVEVPIDEVALLAPTPAPSKIVCVGLNYRDHANESGQAPPEQPLLFSKPPSAIVGPGVAVRLPGDLTHEVDWEAELAVVVGGELDGETRPIAWSGSLGTRRRTTSLPGTSNSATGSGSAARV